MKKILFLALMLGLSGCGENSSSDVSSPITQSNELSQSSQSQVSMARSLSAYSISVPFGGWSLSNPTAVGASVLYDGTKGSLTSSALVTADTVEVAKVLRGGAAGIALLIAVEQLLGAVDWILDPANNQIKYKVYPDGVDPIYEYQSQTTRITYQSMSDLCKADYKYLFPDLDYGGCRIHPLNHGLVEVLVSYQGAIINNSVVGFVISRTKPLEKDEKTLSLETIAQQVISNAESGSLDAQVATMAAAAQIVADAAEDDELAQPIVDDLEANANKCDPRKDENCPPECDPPAGVKFNKVTHYEKHGRDPDPNAGSHGCMAKTGSPIHWHYDVNNQLPDGRCILKGHNFGGCGVAP
ncbi:hypothetical protein [Acinetobacter guerrae]|uniref:hypothetical protein n=1 Tax=Acinetobacter guerrae TaxID=1843371 RepID=UPI00125EB833|nr:hypothetical protein [Acinetobacter guerrae]